MGGSFSTPPVALSSVATHRPPVPLSGARINHAYLRRAGYPTLGRTVILYSSARPRPPSHAPATAEEASDKAPALGSHPVPAPDENPVLRTVLFLLPIPSMGFAQKTGRGQRSRSRAMTLSQKPELPGPLPRPRKRRPPLNRAYLRGASPFILQRVLGRNRLLKVSTMTQGKFSQPVSRVPRTSRHSAEGPGVGDVRE